MILTRDYKTVQASFNTPLAYRKLNEVTNGNWVSVLYGFATGPLKYNVYLTGLEDDWSVSFEVNEMEGTDEELQEYFSRVLKKDIGLEDIDRIKESIDLDTMDDLGVGNAPAVFSTVLAIVREAVSEYHINCLGFSATTAKKARVYHSLVRALSRDWQVTKASGRSFEVCRNGS